MMDLGPALILLLFIIFIGVFFDMIGVAATVAREEPFNAKASKKVFGAKCGLYLARNGERVASFMCDIVGDISGIISRAIAAVIVLRIVDNFGSPQTLVNLLIMGGVSSLTVGGKAYCKKFGIEKADDIIFYVGRLLAGFGFIKNMLSAKIRGEN